ncbi:MAG TPA: sulfurtransferase [Elusimicrobia bacterium]|nr:sulfurtransferase [Elusimicrobiota bacterium]
MATTISPQALAQMRAAGAHFDLIDVRTPAEFEEVHIDFAKNIPLDRLDPPTILASRVSGSGPLYVICQSGMRAGQACKKLVETGLETINIEGGTAAWVAAGLPVVRGHRKVISLERQVRITAGTLVATGTALGYFVNPAWLALSGFVGLGLMFAGITDTCTMAMILSKMSWNQE